MGASVQFVGKKPTLMAFEKRDLIKWAICSGKNINFSYEGDDEQESKNEFEDCLEMMRSNTTALYTVRFYDKSVKAIRPDTKEVGSFNFRLSEEIQPYQHNGMMGATDAMEKFFTKFSERLDAMDKKIAGIQKPDDSERLETWEKLLDHPIVMGGIAKIFDIDVAGMLEQSAKLSGLPSETGEFETTMQTLRKHDPKIEQHLYKLSMIAEKKPQNFRSLISMLEAMAI